MKTMSFLLGLLLLWIPGPLCAGDADFHIGFTYRDFDSDIFGGAEEQGGMAARLDFGGKRFRPALGLSYSASEARHELAILEPFDDEAMAFELSGGFLLSRFDKPFRPYLGAGLSWMWVRVRLLESTGVTISDRDSASGVYVHTGFARRFREERDISFGMDFRYQVGQDLEILGRTGAADYFQMGFLLGFRFLD